MRRKMLRYGISFKMLIMVCTLTLLAGVLAGCGKKTEDTSGNNEEVMQEVVNEDEEQPVVNVAPSEEPEVEEPETTEEPVPSEEPEEEPNRIEINEDIDNVDLAMWLAITEPASEFEVYVWNADGKRAIEVENGEYYSITKDDELIIRCEDSLSPLIVGRNLSYVKDAEYYIYKLDDIVDTYTYIYIQMLTLNENSEIVDTDYKIEFVLQL